MKIPAEAAGFKPVQPSATPFIGSNPSPRQGISEWSSSDHGDQEGGSPVSPPPRITNLTPGTTIIRESLDGGLGGAVMDLRPRLDLLASLKSRRETLRELQKKRVESAEATAFREEIETVQLGGEGFKLHQGGYKQWAYKLTSEDFSIHIAHSPEAKTGSGFPTVLFSVRAECLATYGVDGFTSKFLPRLQHLLSCINRPVIEDDKPGDGWEDSGEFNEPGKPVLLVQMGVSRLDLMCDFQGWEPPNTFREGWICRSQKKGSFQIRSDLEGMGFGKGGQIYVRIYDKSEQIRQQPRHDWVRETWKGCRNYNPNSAVWRIELQLRKEPLRQMGIANFADLTQPGVFASIWATFFRGQGGQRGAWIQLRVPDGPNVTRWKVNPNWRPLMDCDFQQGTHGARVRERQRTARLEQMWPMVAGIAKNVAALGGCLTFTDEAGKEPDGQLTWKTTWDMMEQGVLWYLHHRGGKRPITTDVAVKLHEAGANDPTVAQAAIEDMYERRAEKNLDVAMEQFGLGAFERTVEFSHAQPDDRFIESVLAGVA